MLQCILPKAESVLTVTPDNHRALPAAELAELINGKGVEAKAYESIDAAVETALKESEPSTVILAVGSLYMAGEIRQQVFSRQKEA